MSQTNVLAENPALRVLLVDGNGVFLKAVTDFLKRCPGLAIVGAPSGERQTLALVRELQPQVILLDLDIPDLAGLEAMRQLREQVPGVAVIALTSLDGQAPIGAALAAGARDVVSKSSLINDLLPAIERATATHHLCAPRTPAQRPQDLGPSRSLPCTRASGPCSRRS